MEPLRHVLRSLLIPFQGGQAVLPHSTVVQVLPFAKSLRLENAPPWVTGAILWRSRTTPLVSLERLVCGITPGPGAHSRIIVVNALSNAPRLPSFGLLGARAPQLLDLERTAISLDEATEPLPAGVLSRVRINGQAAIIPDMDAIEAVLSRLMAA